ncbi:MAG: hypothetical protein RL172_2723 [Bacteroidota bacterium]|jgi:hypothetical protein
MSLVIINAGRYVVYLLNLHLMKRLFTFLKFTRKNDAPFEYRLKSGLYNQPVNPAPSFWALIPIRIESIIQQRPRREETEEE